MQILDDIVPELLERREADLQKQRAAARAQSLLTNILPEGEGRCCWFSLLQDFCTLACGL